jgi:predicted ATPase
MNITQFTMEEVRCFAEHQEFRIRPLTFLVGENSTGKTTALACFEVLANYLNGYTINFNLRPYSMGVFKDIVRNSRKTEKAFKLGFTLNWPDLEIDPVEYIVEFVEKKGGVEPVVRSITRKFTDGEIIVRANNITGVRLAFCDKKRNRYHIDVSSRTLLGDSFRSLVDWLSIKKEGQSEDEKAFANYFLSKRDLWLEAGHTLSIYSISPIRSQPKRTYDPTGISDDPEGSDVPEWLMRIKATDKQGWETLKRQLAEFGERSGLFQDIDVRNFGGSMVNPFQLKFKVRGPNSNIIDVGYGISQILPILVYILYPYIYGSPMILSLLQQPEVHLHPKAQAELSSLLAMVAHRDQGRRSFIIETHSDYMIDRARVEIRKGNIRPEEVSLIYLEPKRNVVKVHNISFDKMGNMEGVPPHYREFFMTEYRQLMGFKD